MRPLPLVLLCLPLLAQTPVEQLNALYKEYFEYTLRESPESATFAGRTEYNDRWTDYSPAAVERRRAAARGFLERARSHATASLPASQRMNHRLFLHTLERNLETTDIYYLSVASHYGGIVRSVLGTMDAAPARTMKDFEDRIVRLESMPALVDGLIAAANEGLKRKFQVPRLSVEAAASIYEAQAAPGAGQSPLLK